MSVEHGGFHFIFVPILVSLLSYKPAPTWQRPQIIADVLDDDGP